MIDLINRQTAIDEINERREICSDKWQDGLRMALYVLVAVPSTQPEIIRCQDCLHCKCFHETFTVCDEWGGRRIVKDDDFCSRAERKTNG